MLGMSRTSLAEVTQRLDSVLEAGDADTLSVELFQVVGLLDEQHSLRRYLADASAATADKTGLVGELLESRVSPSTILVINDVVQARWSRPRDMVDAVERLAVAATVSTVEGGAEVEELEDEMFRFDRTLASQPDLRIALTNSNATAQAKRTLLQDLLADRVSRATLRMVTQVVLVSRGRRLEKGLELYRHWAAERARRRIAVVRTAAPLSAQQRDRLQRLLSEAYERAVHMNIEVDPGLVGGMSIRIGDEIIDGSIAGKIAALRRRLTT